MAKVAPAQQAMGDVASIGMNVEETLYINLPEGLQHFVMDHIDIGDMCKMICCPLCFATVPWISQSRKMRYTRSCECCCNCPYRVFLDTKLAGKSHKVKCSDNGLCFCLCPIFTCNGHAKLVGFDDKNGDEKFVFAKDLYPCWPVAESIAVFCAPLGLCCNSMRGCCSYCGGNEFLSITQPVYKGPWNRSSGSEPEKIGNFVMSYRYKPIGCCCALPSPLKFYYKGTTLAGKQLDEEDMALMSLILAIYRGLPTPCPCAGGGAGFQKPTGVSCLDMGLNAEYKWQSVGEIMAESS